MTQLVESPPCSMVRCDMGVFNKRRCMDGLEGSNGFWATVKSASATESHF